MTYSPKKCNPWYGERNKQIVASYQQGQTPEEIADYWRLCASTVRMILHDYGAQPRGGDIVYRRW